MPQNIILSPSFQKNLGDHIHRSYVNPASITKLSEKTLGDHIYLSYTNPTSHQAPVCFPRTRRLGVDAEASQSSCAAGSEQFGVIVIVEISHISRQLHLDKIIDDDQLLLHDVLKSNSGKSNSGENWELLSLGMICLGNMGWERPPHSKEHPKNPRALALDLLLLVDGAFCFVTLLAVDLSFAGAMVLTSCIMDFQNDGNLKVQYLNNHAV